MATFDRQEDRLYQDAELAQFYDLQNGWAADFDFCTTMAEEAGSVLDLGCGTGELAASLAHDRHVVGIDPAAAMLDVARHRPGGDAVDWMEADARDLHLGRRFDLVLLTGHAFQVFLTERDQRAVLSTIAEHLAPDGRFLFDSRNPAAEAWRNWTPEASEHSFEHPRLGKVRSWNEVAYDAESGVAIYQTHFEVLATGQRYAAASQIRFTEQAVLAALLEEAGLAVERWLGDWSGGPWHPAAKEIIPLGRLK